MLLMSWRKSNLGTDSSYWLRFLNQDWLTSYVSLQ